MNDIKRCGPMDSTSISNREIPGKYLGTEAKYQSRLKVFLLFRGLSKETSGEFIRLGNYRALPYPFQFIAHFVMDILSICIKMVIAVILRAERHTV
jgi:hypothetical protein